MALKCKKCGTRFYSNPGPKCPVCLKRASSTAANDDTAVAPFTPAPSYDPGPSSSSDSYSGGGGDSGGGGATGEF